MAFPLPSSNGSGKAQPKVLEKGRDSIDDKNNECDKDRDNSSLTAYIPFSSHKIPMMSLQL